MDQTERCVAPVWASCSPTALPATVDHNGTATFIDTGTRKILVTAHHVLAKFREIQALHPLAGLAVNLGNGVRSFFRHVEVIDEDPEMDLVVIGPLGAAIARSATWPAVREGWRAANTVPVS